jgi:tRNA nucleotidyltransferase (CCA-adding enzyme)
MKVFHLLLSELMEQGYKVWIVGGFIRDFLLGNHPKDVDFATNAHPEQIRAVVNKLGLVEVADHVAFQHGIFKVHIPGTKDIFDIATLRKDIEIIGTRQARIEYTNSIEEDLARRDFTINAMAVEYPPTNPLKIIDPFGGQEDLKNKLIRFVGDPDKRIKEDPLRMIRAARIHGVINGDKIIGIEFIKSNAQSIHSISRERIRDEISKSLKTEFPSIFWRNLKNTNLLEYIMPDLAKGIGCTQNEYHTEDVFDHLLRCLDESVAITNDPTIRLAALFHDIAKPHTKAIGTDGNITFHKHETVGANIVYEWMLRYKFPKKEAIKVSKLVRHHQWYFKEDTSDITLRRWLRDIGKDIWKDLITLRMIDRAGNLKKQGFPLVTKEMQTLIDRVENILANNPVLFIEDLVINGDDIKKHLDIKPGPIYKEIMNNVLGLVIDNPTKNNREYLIQYIKRIYGAKS